MKLTNSAMQTPNANAGTLDFSMEVVFPKSTSRPTFINWVGMTAYYSGSTPLGNNTIEGFCVIPNPASTSNTTAAVHNGIFIFSQFSDNTYNRGYYSVWGVS